jgi:hypothetical protein
LKNEKELESALFKLFKRDGHDVWFSVTFRYPVSSTQAKRKFKYFFNHLNTASERFFEKYISAWVFVEWSESRGGNHIHALIKGVDLSLCPKLERKCIDFFGQSEVKPIHEDVIPYLVRKYFTKTLMDWDYLKINWL